MLSTLAGQCGVVTDATGGVGRAVALELARDRSRVALGYAGADFEAVERIAQEVVGLGGEAIAIRIPANDLGEIERIIAGLVDYWGRLDFVVDLDRLCVFGRAAVPWMLERTHGRLLHISPPTTASGFGFSRHDITELSRFGITLNGITTDSIETRQDVASATYFLLAQSALVTGRVINLGVAVSVRPRRYGRLRGCTSGRIRRSRSS